MRHLLNRATTVGQGINATWIGVALSALTLAVTWTTGNAKHERLEAELAKARGELTASQERCQRLRVEIVKHAEQAKQEIGDDWIRARMNAVKAQMIEEHQRPDDAELWWQKATKRAIREIESNKPLDWYF